MPAASPPLPVAAASWAEDLDLIAQVAVRAGEIAAEHFHRGVRHWVKDGDSPVSEADMAVNHFLAEELARARPDYGWLSEESENDPARLQRPRVFIVDPIDGTRGFIKGSDEWTISIAVAEGAEVRAGVIRNPLKGESFTATSGGGAHCNGAVLKVTERTRIEGARVAAAKGAVRPLGAAAEQLQRSYIPSLAYRFALVARGDFDASLSAGNAHEWDIAAASLIVEEAGGRVTHEDGRRPGFNKAQPTVGPLIAAGATLHAALRKQYATG